LQHLHANELAAWVDTHQADAFVLWQKERLVTPLHVTFDTPLSLESGDSLASFEIRLELYGTINPERNNVILVCHALTGDAHLAGRHHSDDKKTGWWDDLVGDGKAFNPETHAILCTHVLGGCNGSTGPESINPQTQEAYHTSFPPITIADMVNAQHAVMQALQVAQWHAVVGGSMGGFQALEWGIRYPNALKKWSLSPAEPTIARKASPLMRWVAMPLCTIHNGSRDSIKRMAPNQDKGWQRLACWLILRM
jgi:homoserine O-acetyltransferase